MSIIDCSRSKDLKSSNSKCQCIYSDVYIFYKLKFTIITVNSIEYNYSNKITFKEQYKNIKEKCIRGNKIHNII